MHTLSLTAAFCVAIGGALGAAARFAATTLVTARFGAAFPLGVLAVNVAGSFLLGLAAAMIVEAAADPNASGARLRAALLMTGVLGGFTTFSTFALDVVALLERERYSAAATYMLLSVGLSVAAAASGLLLGRAVRA